MKLDLQFVRSQFPAFSEPSLKGWAFFENAGGSYPCKQFIDRLTSFYTKNKVQPYYPYPASILAGELMNASYKRMSEYLNVDASEIHFGPSTTLNVYVLANALRPMWKEGDEIIVSCQDHEANAGAWRKLAARGIIIVEWHVDSETGVLDLEDLRGLISDRTQMVTFPHCSNVSDWTYQSGQGNKPNCAQIWGTLYRGWRGASPTWLSGFKGFRCRYLSFFFVQDLRATFGVTIRA